MKHKLLMCEGCGNIVSVNKNHKPTFVCPACGCINTRDRITQREGYIKLVSPKIKGIVNTDDLEQNALIFPTLPVEIQESIMILNNSGWKIIFKNDSD